MSTDASPPAGPDLASGIPGNALPEGALLAGHAGGEAVLLTRQGGNVFAVGAQCAHYGGPLPEGMVVNGTIRCPWHHAAFDLATGCALHGPAFNGIPTWRVTERDGVIRITDRSEAAPVAVPHGVEERSTAAGPESVLILGGGAAGHYAAETLRGAGYQRPITMVEATPFAPADRPNLSKDYLAGTAPEEWIPLRPDSFYAEHGIELLLNTQVVSLAPASRQVRFVDGTTRDYGALLIATGAEPVPLPGPTPGQPVRLLRTVGDSRAIIAAAAGAPRAVIVGAGFIGLEVAASLRARGLEVTVVSPDQRPLEKVLGAELGDVVRSLHEQQGVQFRLGRSVRQVGAQSVTLDDGEELPAGLVVAGIGVRPRTELAEQAGLAVEQGIVVDKFLETSVPGVYAAGDVARWPDARTGERIRVEHWVVAQRLGQTAALNLLAGSQGQRRPFTAVPFFWSRHYDETISYTGHAGRWDRIEIDGNPVAHDVTVTYRAGGRVLAVATMGRDRAALAAEAALEVA